VESGKRVYILKQGDKSSIDGILLTRGYYMELLEYRDESLLGE
jgi:hypothetical protein